MKSFPAQIVFEESERVDRPRQWHGRLLRPSAVVDLETGKPVTGSPSFRIEERKDGSCHVVMQGGHQSGRRYSIHLDVVTAQTAGIRWAGRRFRIPAENV